MTGQDASYGPLSSLNGFDLPAQSLAQLQGAGLARPVMMNLLHGVPTGMGNGMSIQQQIAAGQV
uniref:Uncharacterized protein n=1 Tax=Brassica oleracea var. oleracea TaxID=109376 RepID=A0A0D3AD01_BRAOL